MRKLCTKDNPCSLLMIEDEALLVELFKTYLSQYNEDGFKVTDVSTLLLALEAIATDELDPAFEIALLDLELPDSAGIDTLDSIIRAVKDRFPVIVLTGTAGQDTESLILSHGAQEVLIKGSIENSEVLRAVRNSIERHHFCTTNSRLATRLEEIEKLANTGLIEQLREVREELKKLAAGHY